MKKYEGLNSIYWTTPSGSVQGMGTTSTCTEGQFFKQLVQEWGKADFVFAGEDSAGRSRPRKLEVEELIERCEKAAKLACRVLEKNGWVETIPIAKLLGEDT